MTGRTPPARGAGQEGDAGDHVPDGGSHAAGLFESLPDPAVRYATDDGRPTVTDVNPAYAAAFDADLEATEPLARRLEGDLDAAEPLARRLEGDLDPAPGATEDAAVSGDETETVDGAASAAKAGEDAPAGDGTAAADVANGAGADESGADAAEGGDADGAQADATEGVAALVEGAAAGETSRAVVRGDTVEGEREYLARVVPLAGADAGDGGYVLLTDVTARRERTRALAAERDRLDEFASVVSHDLRNPLEIARIQLEAAQRRGGDEHFEKVADAHDRIEHIVEDVLALARQGQVIDDVGEVGLASVAADAWAGVATPAATLEVATDAVVRADPARLQELLENLFRNAVEHAGPDVAVTVGPTVEGFYVADDGPGLPEAARDRVFEAGVSTGDDGTGLGLVIVERVAEAHGWRVAAGEAEGGGARFDVSGVEVVD